MKKSFLLVLLAVALSSFAQAAVITQVTFDSSLMADGQSAWTAQGPFSLAFILGGGSEAGNNTAILDNFDFGVGSADGSPILIGGASGTLASGVTLTDTDTDNFFIEGVHFGDILRFNLTLTTNVDAGGIPDEFIWSILDSTGNPLPTISESPLAPFLSVTLDSANPTFSTFDGDPSAIFAPAPTVVGVSAVPEPATIWLCAFGLSSVLWFRPRKIN